MKVLEVIGLKVCYGDLVALEDVNITVEQGEMLAVLGPNGSGKSSLFKSIVGLVRPKEGKILLFGKEPGKARGLVAYVPQREDVYWDYPITVWDLAAMGRVRQVGRFKQVNRSDPVVVNALKAVGMESLADKKISELSGGQQQRAFLARSIAQGAELYLLDEPLAGLDADAEDKLFDVLLRLKKEGKAIVMTTHDISSTFELFDKVLLLRNRIIAHGRPEEVLTAENLMLAYGSERVAMHLEDIRRVAGWR